MAKAREKGRHAIKFPPPLSKKKAFFCQQLFKFTPGYHF
jgi:hypothetical protein